jgi:metal-responsive CopG/Arc/MetJ family transcriptional regulator
MKHQRISVTIPQEVYQELKRIIDRGQHKLSHIVAEAIAEKLRRMEEEVYLEKINAAFKDPEIDEEQKRMADLIAESTDVSDLPW